MFRIIFVFTVAIVVFQLYEACTTHKNVHARWVPRLLKDREKEKRVRDSSAFLRRYEKEGDRFRDRIITTDETWLWLHDPETKQQSAVWKRSGFPPPEKARVSKSGGKFLFIMFCDRKGMLLQHVVQKDTNVNAAYYSKCTSGPQACLGPAGRKQCIDCPCNKTSQCQLSADGSVHCDCTNSGGYTGASCDCPPQPVYQDFIPLEGECVEFSKDFITIKNVYLVSEAVPSEKSTAIEYEDCMVTVYDRS